MTFRSTGTVQYTLDRSKITAVQSSDSFGLIGTGRRWSRSTRSESLTTRCTRAQLSRSSGRTLKVELLMANSQRSTFGSVNGRGPFISRSSFAPMSNQLVPTCRQRLLSLGHTHTFKFLCGESTWLSLGIKFSFPSRQNTIQYFNQDILCQHRRRRCGKHSTDGATLVSMLHLSVSYRRLIQHCPPASSAPTTPIRCLIPRIGPFNLIPRT
jgi:hypothetical protein